MIKLDNVSHSFGKQAVIKNISLELPDRGLICVCGASGCGKTTLLNIISGLLKPDSGEIIHDNIKIYNLNDDNLSNYRIKNFGFVFQDYKLFENETILNNISLPLDTISYISTKAKTRKVKDIMSLVDLKHPLKTKCKNISGGEKQRVAIARAIVNNPKVIFADEPTGSLDDKNSVIIMEILQKISANALVIVVSHDIELVKRYANEIIYMSDGVIDRKDNINSDVETSFLPIKIEKKKLKRSSLPTGFLFNHSISCLRKQKYRTLICNLVMSFSLVGFGAAISLTSSISANIKKAYSEVIGDDRIVMSRKKSNQQNEPTYSIDLLDAFTIRDAFKNDVEDIGVVYYANFEGLFPDYCEYRFESDKQIVYCDDYFFRDINEFQWTTSDLKTYPHSVDNLNNNEVILGLTIKMVSDLCFGLRIERTVTSLEHYLMSNDLKMVLEVENHDWDYSKSVEFSVCGFILTNQPCFFHSNHYWNEYIYETQLSLVSNYNISSSFNYPWELKKILYLKTKNGVTSFLEKAFDNELANDYLFEIANQQYYKRLFKNISTKDIDRVLAFKNNNYLIRKKDLKIVETYFQELKNPLFATSGGYAIYPQSFMSGFAKQTYLSSHEKRIYEIVDNITGLSKDNNEFDSLPDDVVSAHYSSSLQGGVIFKNAPQEIIFNSLNDIAISRGLANKLFPNENPIGKSLYYAFNDNEKAMADGSVMYNYSINHFNIVAVTNDNDLAIYQNNSFLVLFFQCELGVSIFDLQYYCVSYEIDKRIIDSTVEALNKAFLGYEFINPMADFNSGVDEVCSYITMGLTFLSIVALVVSVLLLATCSYLHTIENKKDIGLARCLGISKKESVKFLYSYSLITGLLSFLMSTIELVVLTGMSTLSISSILHASSAFVFDPIALVAMFLLSIGISTFSSLIFARRLTKMNPLESLKQ